MDNYFSIADRTKQFAIRVVKACGFLDEEDWLGY